MIANVRHAVFVDLQEAPGGKPGRTPGTELPVVVALHKKVRQYQSVKWSDSTCKT
jgi:hypothetical protein